MIGQLDSRIPAGPLGQKWEQHKFDSRLINPANRRKYEVIVVGSGLAGGAAAATLGELGYGVKCFCYQDSARRAHSIAAQGGINAAKNYQNDGDSSIPALSTIPSRAATSAPAKLTSTGWRRSRLQIIDQSGCPRCSLRPRVRRLAGQPLLRRRPSFPHLLRPRDRPGQQLLLGAVLCAEPPNCRRQCEDVSRSHRDAGPGGGGWPRQRHHRAQSRSRARSRHARGRLRSAGHGRVWQCLLPLHERQGVQHLAPFGAPTARARSSLTPATRRFTPPAFPVSGDYQSQAHAHERVAPQ